MDLYSASFLPFFFFKQKTAYEMRISDWSSDVCSSDLQILYAGEVTTAAKTEMRQELSCRCKKQGASGNLAAPSRTNPARLHQNVKRSSCYLHAAYGLYLSAADRLVIGDDSQRFHGCTRKLRCSSRPFRQMWPKSGPFLQVQCPP